MYYARLGMAWAAPISVGFLWLMQPECWGVFMPEAPAYALGVGAWLPLLVGGVGAMTVGLSAALAAVALGTKLTAAFALVVPFVWLWQRSWRQALAWGLCAVGLLAISSWLLPGWSWSAMWAAHVKSNIAQAQSYRFHPDVYAQGWLLGALALVTVGSRYLARAVAPVVPWLAAAAAALAIHLVHRPFFGYYSLHLIAPVAVLGALGLVEIGRWVSAGTLPQLERWALAGASVVACGAWVWQRTDQLASLRDASMRIDDAPIVQALRALPESDRRVYSADPTWTFATGLLQVPPEFTIVSLKRVWSGQIDDERIVDALRTNRLAAVVVPVGFLKHGTWSNYLADFTPAARFDETAVFVAKRLKPRSIELEDHRRLYRALGLKN